MLQYHSLKFEQRGLQKDLVIIYACAVMWHPWAYGHVTDHYIFEGAQSEVVFTKTLPLALTECLDTLLGLLSHVLLIC